MRTSAVKLYKLESELDPIDKSILYFAVATEIFSSRPIQILCNVLADDIEDRVNREMLNSIEKEVIKHMTDYGFTYSKDSVVSYLKVLIENKMNFYNYLNANSLAGINGKCPALLEIESRVKGNLTLFSRVRTALYESDKGYS